MSGRALPVLNFAPFRKYPTKLAEQEFDDDRNVCGSCLSGVCCSSEDPIYLTSFDVFRLATFFDLSPAEFLLTFTQERFDGEDSEVMRRPWIEDPESSKVTYLRRRGNTPTSPCVFLKYIREEDGTPRRICSVHDARPLSCREYYFHHCKTRQTGELAALEAEGYEKIRDGEITEELVDAQLARFDDCDFSSASAAESLEYSFWVEMKRVLNMEQANVEGSRSYEASEYQDPIDEKLNRVLSAKYLRFEEDYGPKPHSEQLMPYTSGLTFANSRERARIMKLVQTRPSSRLYAGGDYPFSFAMRSMMPGVRHAEVFQMIPAAEVETFLAGIAPVSLFPNHDAPEVRAITRQDVYASALKALNHFIRFAGYLDSMGNVLECESPGALELELLAMISSLETSPHTFVARNPYLEPVKLYASALGIGRLEEIAGEAKRPTDFLAAYRVSCSVEAAAATLPTDLRNRFAAVADTILLNLRAGHLEDYVGLTNPVAARQAAGKRLTARGAWAAWERSALDVSYAARAGVAVPDISDYYRRSVAELESIPFRKSYLMSLCRVVLSLARGMHSCARTAPCTDAAARLASYGSELLDWIDEEWGRENLPVEMLAGFASSVFSGTGGGHDRNLGLVVRRILDAQLPDGSWEADPRPVDPEMSQADYLLGMCQATRACVDGLLSTQRDVV